MIGETYSGSNQGDYPPEEQPGQGSAQDGFEVYQPTKENEGSALQAGHETPEAPDEPESKLSPEIEKLMKGLEESLDNAQEDLDKARSFSNDLRRNYYTEGGVVSAKAESVSSFDEYREARKAPENQIPGDRHLESVA